MKQEVSKDIYTIDNFWTHQKCDEFILKSEKIGYEPATIQTGWGHKIVQSVRNNNRVMYKDFELAGSLWDQLKDFPPEKIGKSKPISLNELFRFYKYEPGQKFKKHRDMSYIRNDVEASYYTFMIYLNDSYIGGETIFDEIKITPKKGTALVFLHSIQHEGAEVTKGIKYVLRTDIMFSIDNQSVD